MPPERSLEIVDLPTSKLHPNPWNPNQQQPAVARALKESIDAYGHIAPIVVRDHPELKGEWQIIDGEHRWREAVEREQPTVPCVVLALGDAEARKLTIILNEVTGDADVALLGALLVDLESLLPDDELALALPYSRSELDHLLALGRENWDDFEGRLISDDGDPEHTLSIKFGEGAFEEVSNYLVIIEKELELDRPAALLAACRQLASDLHSKV